MISDTFRIYRKLRNTRENTQPWMKLREEYAWLQPDTKYPPNTQTTNVQKNQAFSKR